jgi:hypothetical protein
MLSEMSDSFNISVNDILLVLGFYIIQHKNPFIELFGYILLIFISYIEIKKRRETKKKYYYINIIYSATKKDYTIYNNIIESINNKEYQNIDIAKTYNELVNLVNELDYDFYTINNFCDIIYFMTTIDNMLHLNKKWGSALIEHGDHILDIYARLVNQLHNMLIVVKEYDIDGKLLRKELDELYSKYNYNNDIKNILIDFFYKYN